MDNQVKKTLYEGLREHHGSIQRVVERTESLKEGGYSREYIRLVLTNDDYYNIDILNICAEVLTEVKAKREAAENRLKAHMVQLSIPLA